ncbi:MAG: hypothetical protein IKA61_01060 [Clostridia bacterium]|nr:hypothetical protein [Clostridia bacterium]
MPLETVEEASSSHVEPALAADSAEVDITEQLIIEKDDKEVENEVVMEKTRTDILIEKSKVNYNAVIKIIGDMYDRIFSKDPSFGYARKELFADYDSYLQAILIKLCSVKDDFSKTAMTFVENVTDYGKLVEGTDFSFFADCAKEMREVICQKAEERLKDVPVCFKLAGAVDSARGLGVTKSMLDATVKIAFNLKFIDPNADLKDNSDVISSLKAIYVFAKANGINIK